MSACPRCGCRSHLLNLLRALRPGSPHRVRGSRAYACLFTED